MSLDKYCCDALGTHEVICASDKRKGGISALVLIKTDQTTITDWTSATQWNTAIANGDVNIIEEISAEYPQATPIETESHVGCGPDNELDGFTHVLNATDRAVTANNDRYYEDVNTCRWHLGYFDCQKNGDDKIWIVEENLVTVVVTPAIIEKGSQTVQRYAITATWVSNADEFPRQYDAPPGIFSTE